MKILFIILIVANCTGIQIKTNPEPESFKEVFKTRYNSIGLRDIPSVQIIPLSINMTENFAHEIRVSQFSKDVYYPYRPDDKVDILLESQYNSEMDMNFGTLLLKTTLTALTLFLAEPFIWYNIDYFHTGNISVFKDGKIVKEFSVKTHSTISFKYWSIGDAQRFQSTAFVKARKSLFRQILQKIENDNDIKGSKM